MGQTVIINKGESPNLKSPRLGEVSLTKSRQSVSVSVSQSVSQTPNGNYKQGESPNLKPPRLGDHVGRKSDKISAVSQCVSQPASQPPTVIISRGNPQT